MSIVVAKLGSSTLVGRDGNVRPDVIAQRVDDLARVMRLGHQPVLVSSGAIACGYRPLGFRERPTSLPDLQAASAVGQGVLYRHYQEAFGRHDVTPAQVLLTSADVAGRTTYLNARNTLHRLIDLGAVPVINENDTTATDELTFGDNDVLAAQVAILLGATWLVLLTDRDGLYGVGADGETHLIGDVPPGRSPRSLSLAPLGGSGLGRGGIASKIDAAAMAVAAGVTTVIASGARADAVTAVTRGRVIGTRFRSSGPREPAFKLWLRNAKPSLGRVTVDDGAVKALRARGTSLLAVGVTGVDGDFLAGDAVDVVDAGGAAVGKGIVALDHDDLVTVAGLRSRVITERGLGISPEVIHRDQFVLANG